MKQSRAHSLIEAVISTAVGFALSLALQWAFFVWWLGLPLSFTSNLIFAVIMTVVSIGRGYLLRRVFEALHIRHPISPFMAAVIAERRRQVEQEGWSAEHDDGHRLGEIAEAGAAYLGHAGTCSPHAPANWPWGSDWFKPSGFRRDLVKGCALGIAEGEKFDRNRRRHREAA
jgi:hypothetical protein